MGINRSHTPFIKTRCPNSCSRRSVSHHRRHSGQFGPSHTDSSPGTNLSRHADKQADKKNHQCGGDSRHRAATQGRNSTHCANTLLTAAFEEKIHDQSDHSVAHGNTRHTSGQITPPQFFPTSLCQCNTSLDVIWAVSYCQGKI